MFLMKKQEFWRPFLAFSHEEIAKLHNGKKIPHREDQSNATIKYSRNRIRLNVIPELEMVSTGAENKLYEAAKEITDLYEYVLDVHRELIVSDEISFHQIAVMPKSLSKLIIGKFIKDKIQGFKLKKILLEDIYVALLEDRSLELNIDSELSASVKGGKLKVIKSSEPFAARRKQHEKFFKLEKVENILSESTDLEIVR